MTFKLTINCKDLLSYAKLFNSVAEQGVFVVTKGGISLKCIDAAHVALLSLNIKPRKGDNEIKYEPGALQFAIYSDQLMQILSKLPADKSVTLKGVTNGKLTISCDGAKFNIKTVELALVTYPIPKMRGSAVSIALSQDLFYQYLTQARLIDEWVILTTKKNGVTVSTAGESGDYTSPAFGTVKGIEAQVKLSLEYLIPFIQNMGDMSAKFSKGSPLYLKSNDGSVEAYIAPKIER